MSEQVSIWTVRHGGLGLVLLVVAILLGASRSTSIATIPVSRLETPWWRQRFEEKQRELQIKHVDLLWLGDSITQNWERDGPQAWQDFVPVWNHFYGDRNAINLGFRGDSTCHLLWRLQHGELVGIKPKAAILLIGANNFGHIHTNADETYAGIVVILELLHHRLPATKILLIGVLPSLRSQWVTDNTRLLNQRLARLPAAEGNWVRYIDVSAIFQQGGRVDPNRFFDPRLHPPDPPLHPTAFSQAAISSMIEPSVAAMLGDRQHEPLRNW